MKKYSPKQLAKSLYELTKDAKKSELDSLLGAYTKFLAKNKALKFSARIINEFEKYFNEQNGIAEIKVASAKKLEPEVRDKIRKSFLDKKIKEVEIKERVDSALIGGLKIRIGDTIYDGSVSNYILKIKEKLK